MWKKCLRLFLVTITCCLSTQGIFAQASASLEWGKPITFSDFEAPPVRKDTAAANISVTILLGYSNTASGALRFRVVAVMDKDESWIKEEFRKDHILKHEQGHFDIAHIYAKKLDTELKRKRYVATDLQPLNKLYDHFLEQMNQIQIRYDKETKGGWDGLAQSKWRRWIDKELDQTKTGVR